MKPLFIFLKWLFIITILFVAHAYITSNTHIFSTLSQTILKGRIGPSVDTKKLFSIRKVNAGKPQAWEKDERLGKLKIDPSFEALLKSYNTLAFLIIKDNKLVYEKYSNSYNEASETNNWSVTKSIMSILVGAAIKDGKIKSVYQNVSDFLPEYEGTNLKIWHLLTMSSGINFKETYINPYGYPAKALYGDNLEKLNKRYRVNNTPGKYFIYRSGNTQILGFLLKKAVGKNIADYASEKLWRKIGAEKPAYWSLDKSGGMEKTFCCFHTNARDLAKVGQLMLQKGIWNGDTIIPRDYYKKMIEPAPLLEMDGKQNKIYGYLYWLVKYKGLHIYYSRGKNGQYIINIPSKNIVIVRLGRDWELEKVGGHHKDFYAYIDAVLALEL